MNCNVVRSRHHDTIVVVVIIQFFLCRRRLRVLLQLQLQLLLLLRLCHLNTFFTKICLKTEKTKRPTPPPLLTRVSNSVERAQQRRRQRRQRRRRRFLTSSLPNFERINNRARSIANGRGVKVIRVDFWHTERDVSEASSQLARAFNISGVLRN